MSDMCAKCYWFEMTNPKEYRGICHNTLRRIWVVGEYCCYLYEPKEAKKE